MIAGGKKLGVLTIPVMTHQAEPMPVFMPIRHPGARDFLRDRTRPPVPRTPHDEPGDDTDYPPDVDERERDEIAEQDRRGDERPPRHAPEHLDRLEDDPERKHDPDH